MWKIAEFEMKRNGEQREKKMVNEKTIDLIKEMQNSPFFLDETK